MIRIRKRKNPITYDVAEVPVLSTKRPMLNAQTDLYRSNEKLRSLMNEEKYEQAKKLFIELVKSNRFHFQHLWKIGVEIIGKTSPKDLTGYLKAVFISSPVKHSAETFNVYIDYLIAENSWELALDEIQPRYDTPIFHHPILLRKMAICCYNLWKSARNNLPEEYLEDGERNENDLRIIRYEKHLRFAARYLSEAHKTYSGDPELLLIYYDYLTLLEEEDTIKDVILTSLKESEARPESHILTTLLKLNAGKDYFESSDYILQLFELDPFMDAELGLVSFCKEACSEIKRAKKRTASVEQVKEAEELATRIFKLYVLRFESVNPEAWFQKRMMKILKYRMSGKILQVYQNYQLDTLLRSQAIARKMDMDMNKQANNIKNIMLKYQNKLEDTVQEEVSEEEAAQEEVSEEEAVQEEVSEEEAAQEEVSEEEAVQDEVSEEEAAQDEEESECLNLEDDEDSDEGSEENDITIMSNFYDESGLERESFFDE